MKRLKISIFAAVALFALGRSNQWRDADAELTDVQLMEMLADVKAQEGTAFVGGSTAEALALKDEEGVAIYFADAIGPFGGPANVLSVIDFSFLGEDYVNSDIFQFKDVRVFFFDVASSGKTGLIIGLLKNGETDYKYVGFVGSSGIEDGEYQTALGTDGNIKLILRSRDVEDDQLSPVIQLRVYDEFDEDIGKIPTLVGYGG